MKNLTTLLFTALVCFSVKAQKLPNIQAEAGLAAPSNIQIDGKTTEWNNQFKAYNHATDIFYTISNDNDNLYLTVQATDPSVINKILRGGIAFAINAADKKTDKDAACITYPVFNARNRPNLNINKKSLEGGKVTLNEVSDSIVLAYNHMLKERSKLIMVTGIPGVDTLTSVYNNIGIRTAELYDSKMAYTCEFAIDLKLLKIQPNSKFAYHITLSGKPPINVKPGENGDMVITAISAAPQGEVMTAKMNLERVMLDGVTAATDFWGEYTLASSK